MSTQAVFPLHLVAFPFHTVALRIFEPRYREMLADCKAQGRGFVISHIARGTEVGGPATPFRIGTEMSISSLQEDGGMVHVEAIGVRRVELTEFDHTSRSYLLAESRPYEDDRPDDGRVEGLLALWTAYLREVAHLGRDQIEAWCESRLFRLPLPKLTFALAPFLKLPYANMQFLLECRDPNRRRDNVIHALEWAMSGTTP